MVKKEDMQANCQALAEHVREACPPEIGFIAIMYNRRTGDTTMAAVERNRKAVNEILRSLSTQAESSLIIPVKA